MGGVAGDNSVDAHASRRGRISSASPNPSQASRNYVPISLLRSYTGHPFPPPPPPPPKQDQRTPLCASAPPPLLAPGPLPLPTPRPPRRVCTRSVRARVGHPIEPNILSEALAAVRTRPGAGDAPANRPLQAMSSNEHVKARGRTLSDGNGGGGQEMQFRRCGECATFLIVGGKDMTRARDPSCPGRDIK